MFCRIEYYSTWKALENPTGLALYVREPFNATPQISISKNIKQQNKLICRIIINQIN